MLSPSRWPRLVTGAVAALVSLADVTTLRDRRWSRPSSCARSSRPTRSSAPMDASISHTSSSSVNLAAVADHRRLRGGARPGRSTTRTVEMLQGPALAGALRCERAAGPAPTLAPGRCRRSSSWTSTLPPDAAFPPSRSSTASPSPISSRPAEHRHRRPATRRRQPPRERHLHHRADAHRAARRRRGRPAVARWPLAHRQRLLRDAQRAPGRDPAHQRHASTSPSASRSTSCGSTPDGRLFTRRQVAALELPVFRRPRSMSVADGVVVASARTARPSRCRASCPPTPPTRQRGRQLTSWSTSAPAASRFYAHMQPGSLRVKTGDRVKRGSGARPRSATPATPTRRTCTSTSWTARPRCASNGLPYMFTSFVGDGMVTERGAARKLVRRRRSTRRRCRGTTRTSCR